MQARLVVERIERRISVDTVSDAEWLRTEAETTDEGGLRILDSVRYSDDDVREHGAAQVREWIAEDHRRYRGFQEGEWWFLDVCAVAVIGVHLDEDRIGQVGLGSVAVGGIGSDTSREYLDEMTGILVTEVKDELTARGFIGLDEVETPLVVSEPWVADAVRG